MKCEHRDLESTGVGYHGSKKGVEGFKCKDCGENLDEDEVPKWYVGDKAWDVLMGLVVLEKKTHNNSVYVWKIDGDMGLPIDKIFSLSDGRITSNEKYTRILTLWEARQRGYPVPKKKRVESFRTTWKKEDGFIIPSGMLDEDNASMLQSWVGTTGKLTYEYEA